MTNTLIAGEAVDDIARALGHLKMGPPRDDGTAEMTAKMPRDVFQPFLRALMRIEAELIVEDADELSSDSPEVERTDDERRFDAFVELVERFSRAAEANRRKN